MPPVPLRRTQGIPRPNYPDWYMFITDNKLVHYGSGKYTVADEEDITTLEVDPHPQAAVIFTPKKRTASRAAGTPIRLFTREQADTYMKSAPMVEKVDRDIAAFILRCITPEGARNELFVYCGHRGRYMLIFIVTSRSAAKERNATPSRSSRRLDSTSAGSLASPSSTPPAGPLYIKISHTQ